MWQVVRVNEPQHWDSLAVTVLKAVADREGVDVTDLPPLDDIVNPDALDEVFARKHDGTPRQGGRITFSYAGYSVTVHSDQGVELREQDW